MFKVYKQCFQYRKRYLNGSYISFRCFSEKPPNSFPQISGLDPGYVPSKVEALTQDANYFNPESQTSEVFSMILPPPNITGNLHLGHAFTATIEDVLIRWKQMQGISTVWIPGTDHAGIATQVVVEKKLWKEKGLTRHDLGREKFVEEVWKWKKEKEKIMRNQLQRLNLSLNWDKEVFTMDSARSKATTEAFIRLFNSGLIYRADQLVNWSCILQSAISDIEVESLNIEEPTDIRLPGYDHPVRFGILTKFAYKFVDSDEELVVATTRPETVLGDVAVAVSPKDERYSRYAGRYLWHPFRKQTIPVIQDDFVDPNFGTGAVKVTPAHNSTDFEVGKRHNLAVLQVIDEKGNISIEDKRSVPRFQAREIIIKRLSELGLFRGSQPHKMSLPICSRSKDVVELLVRPQWFINCQDMASKALEELSNGQLHIEPEEFGKTWLNWLGSIRDWNISRQLWWGHRIPAYYCGSKSDPEKSIWVAAHNSEEAKNKALKLLNNPQHLIVEQDEDVLDTWFTSSLQPFSAFAWPENSPEFQKYFPLSMMETGHDILFFWVARMVMIGMELTGQLPFNKILLHGVLCDGKGRKMSKSLGNVVAPEEIIDGSTLLKLQETIRESQASGVLSREEALVAIEGQKKMFPKGIPECGADALRFTLMSHNIKNHFINFDLDECYTNKLFCNKIWQATKFSLLWYQNVVGEKELSRESLGLMDRWILSRLSHMVNQANSGLTGNEFYVATNSLKEFLYFDFCDVYLESTKRGLRDVESSRALGHVWTLLTCLEVGLRALAPFMPALAQHLHKAIPDRSGLKKKGFPEDEGLRDIELEKEVSKVLDLVKTIRRLRKIFGVTGKQNPEVFVTCSSLQLLEKFNETVKDLSGCFSVAFSQGEDVKAISGRKVVEDRVGDCRVFLVVPEEQLNQIRLDSGKLENQKEKVMKELQRMEKMISGNNYYVKVCKERQEVDARKVASLKEKLQRINYMQKLAN